MAGGWSGFTHVAPAGVLQSEADLLAFLDTGSLTNAKVAELNLVQANYQSFTMRSPPESECGGGGGGGGGGQEGRAPRRCGRRQAAARAAGRRGWRSSWQP